MDQLLRSYNSKLIADGDEPIRLTRPPYSHKKKSVNPYGKHGRIRQKIGDRDGWICQLCKKPIEHQIEATVDHITAKSNGGTDAQYNLQIAHARCNSVKGNHPQREPEFYQLHYRKRVLRIEKVVPADKETRIVPPAPTMHRCVFSTNGFCRTQLPAGFWNQCGIKEGSFAHQVCQRTNKENADMDADKKLKRGGKQAEFMTTEADDYNARK